MSEIKPDKWIGPGSPPVEDPDKWIGPGSPPVEDPVDTTEDPEEVPQP